MAYKILENNGVDNENIDGGAFNNLAAGNKSGIVGNVLNECAVAATGNHVIISPGLLILHGVRVKITESETISVASTPSSDVTYQLVAQITMTEAGAISFMLFAQTPTELTKDRLFVGGGGTYQIELGRFTHQTDGAISGAMRTASIIRHGGDGFPEAPETGRAYGRKDGEWVDISDIMETMYTTLGVMVGVDGEPMVGIDGKFMLEI